MTIEDFMSVVPHWADNNKRAAFMELVKNWVGENPDFKAVSDRNKANRGNQGTHSAGSSSTDRYRERLGKKLGRELGEMEAWTHMKLVTPRPNEPRPAPEMYYGKAKENKERYCEEYAKLHPEVEDPMTEPVDEVAMMSAGLNRRAFAPFLGKNGKACATVGTEGTVTASWVTASHVCRR
ncbi:uncharacterized protein [Lolium perenne]|uniref:uncharacterized protein n=1 Tax=Lolium perenne TaxID=4522 RepID=UPI003A98ED2D